MSEVKKYNYDTRNIIDLSDKIKQKAHKPRHSSYTRDFQIKDIRFKNVSFKYANDSIPLYIPNIDIPRLNIKEEILKEFQISKSVTSASNEDGKYDNRNKRRNEESEMTSNDDIKPRMDYLEKRQDEHRDDQRRSEDRIEKKLDDVILRVDKAVDTMIATTQASEKRVNEAITKALDSNKQIEDRIDKKVDNMENKVESTFKWTVGLVITAIIGISAMVLATLLN
ncbi:hypothetical protein [Salipaludibacillus sp. CF4.18]|uniref:hypothetical protein n=1 Tax=Salipaludibacillus sp. CF4.18 TaxID=3373081 RepID=UPI003EE6F87F